MCTTRHPRRYLVPLVSTGLVLVSLLGCLTLPAASASGVEPSAHREYQDYGDYWGRRDPWRQRRDWPHPRPKYELPDRYTIHKGKKCELRCERIRGTRDYRCREYRC